jgi:hypothetical protein
MRAPGRTQRPDSLWPRALLKEPERFRNGKTVLVICGRNIDIERFKKIIGN